MEKKVTKWNQSNYQIELTVAADEHAKARQQMLKNFQKDMDVPGFRKWFVPMSMVEQNIRPEYMEVWIYEEIINIWLREVVKENPSLRFIGEAYDVNQDKKGDKTTVSLKLDVFPEVDVLNDAWKNNTMKEMKIDVTEEEIDNSIKELKRNYADYQNAEAISTETISKVSMEYLDKEWKVIGTSSLFIGEPEYNEDPFYKNTFTDKKVGDSLELSYKKDDMPKQVQYTKTEEKPSKVRFTVKDIKKIILPEMTEEMLNKLFGKDSTVKTEAQLRDFIAETIKNHKADQELVKVIEELLNKVRWASMKIELPKTLVEKEHENRVQNLEKRFGTKERVEDFFKQMGEEKAKAFLQDIRKSASESLEKYFILIKMAEELWLDIDRDHPQDLEAEKKIYAALSSGDLSANAGKPTKKVAKKDEEKEEAKPAKKAPAKKATEEKEPKKAVKKPAAKK